MATLTLTSTASDINPGSEDERQISLSGGTTPDCQCSTTDGGTQIQLQRSGTNVTWLTKPLNAVTISGSMYHSIQGYESGMAVNAKFGCKVERCSGTGTVISTILDSSDDVEMAYGSTANQNWSATPPSSVALSTGDRIKVTVYARNAGTMAAGTVYMTSTVNAVYVTTTESVTEASATTSIKQISGVPIASVKKVSGVAIAGVKKVSGVSNVS